MSPGYSNVKVDALISGHISIDGTWTEEDFRALALAAADQGGLTLRETDKVAAIINGSRQQIRTVR